MKYNRKRLTVLVIIVSILIIFYLHFSRMPEVSSSSVMSNHMSLNVVANRLFIMDKEKFAEEIVEKCRNNSFSGVKFSYDLRIPKSLDVAIYSSRYQIQSGAPLFSFSYEQDDINGDYDIVNNPEKFKIFINE